MSDQDFNIKVITTADTTGLQQTSQKLKELREQSRQDIGAAALFARIPPGGPAPSAGPQGRDPLAHIGTGFERFALHAIGIGAVLEALNGIKQLAGEINKITESLDKQGEQLVANSRQMIMQAKFAEDDAGVLKVAEEGMKSIAAQHKIVEELQQKELTNAQKIADTFSVDPAFAGQGGPNQQRLDEERAQAQSNEQAARRTAISSLATAEREKERRAAQGLSQDIEELNQKLAHENELKQAAYAAGDIQGYVEAAQAAKQYSTQLENVIALQKKESAETEKKLQQADPQVQRILQNEAAARRSAAQGRDQDAEMFTKSAEEFKRAATPQQLQQVQRAEADPNLNTAMDRLAEKIISGFKDVWQ